MIYEKTPFTLKDGKTAILRSPCEDDAAEMLDFIRKSSGETVFLVNYSRMNSRAYACPVVTDDRLPPLA